MSDLRMQWVAGELAERGWWLQFTHGEDGRWSWCAGHANADLTGGNAEDPEGLVESVAAALEAGRFDAPERLERVMRGGRDGEAG